MRARAISATIIVSLLLMLFVVPVHASVSNPEVMSIVINPTQPYQSTIWTDKASYNVGENIKISYRTDRDAYVYIFDVDTSGKVSLVFPNIYSTYNYARAGATYSLPDNSNYYYGVTGPDGTDTLIMITVPQPLSNSIDWIQASLLGNNFGPQLNGYTSSTTYMAQVIASNIMPNYGTNWSSSSTTFKVLGSGSGSSIIVNPGNPSVVQQYGTLEVTSSPSGARVFINGEERGVTPMTINSIPYGSYEVNILSSGYYSFKKSFEIDSSSPYRISASLTKIQGNANVSETLVLNKSYKFKWPSIYDVNESVSYNGHFATMNLKLDQYFGNINSIRGNITADYSLSNEFMSIYANQTSQLWKGKTYEIIEGYFKVVVTLEDYVVIKGSYGQSDTFESVNLNVKVYYLAY